MHVGQALAYNILWYQKGRLWGIKLSTVPRKTWVECAALAVTVLLHLYGGSLCVSAVYLVSLNVTYAIMILPDHDQIGTKENHVDGDSMDWGIVQVKNSGNFANGGWDVVCRLFGGINYQIEHHLFPSVSHVHLPALAPIVRKVCEDFDVPYVAEPTVFAAFRASLDSYRSVQLAIEHDAAKEKSN
jgi:fatty acid desaturase